MSGRIQISTKKQVTTGVLPLTIDEQDVDLVFSFATLTEFKQAVKLTIKAKDIYLEIENMKEAENPIEILELFEETTEIYKDALSILLGKEAFEKLEGLLGNEIPSRISQSLIADLGELYSRHFMVFSESFLTNGNKL